MTTAGVSASTQLSMTLLIVYSLSSLQIKPRYCTDGDSMTSEKAEAPPQIQRINYDWFRT